MSTLFVEFDSLCSVDSVNLENMCMLLTNDPVWCSLNRPKSYTSNTRLLAIHLRLKPNQVVSLSPLEASGVLHDGGALRNTSDVITCLQFDADKTHDVLIQTIIFMCFLVLVCTIFKIKIK